MKHRSKKGILSLTFAYIKRNSRAFIRLFHELRKIKLTKNRPKEFKTVVFFQIYPAGWNSVRPLYDFLSKDPNYKIIVMVSPKKDDIDKERDDCDSYEFFRRIINKENLIFSYNFSTKKWKDLKTLKPDFVFYTRPYDKEIPFKAFRSKQVSSYARVCFLDYGYGFSNEYTKFWKNESLIYYASHIFSENNTKFKEYEKHLRINKFLRLVTIHNLGFPRFELIKRNNLKSMPKKVLWISRWTLDSYNPDRSTFLKNIWPLLNFFEQNKDLELICRPHPNMIDNLLSSGDLSTENFNKIKNKINDLQNVVFDEDPNYLDSIESSEILLADYSTLIADYFCTQKPIIYLGNFSHFNNEASEIAEGFYKPTNIEAALDLILKLSKGNDTLEKKRKFLSDNFYNRNVGSIKRTVEAIENSN